MTDDELARLYQLRDSIRGVPQAAPEPSGPGFVSRLAQNVGNFVTDIPNDAVQVGVSLANLATGASPYDAAQRHAEVSEAAQQARPFQLPPAQGFGPQAADLIGGLGKAVIEAGVPGGMVTRGASLLGAGRMAPVIGDFAGGGLLGLTQSPREGLSQGAEFSAIGAANEFIPNRGLRLLANAAVPVAGQLLRGQDPTSQQSLINTGANIIVPGLLGQYARRGEGKPLLKQAEPTQDPRGWAPNMEGQPFGQFLLENGVAPNEMRGGVVFGAGPQASASRDFVMPDYVPPQRQRRRLLGLPPPRTIGESARSGDIVQFNGDWGTVAEGPDGYYLQGENGVQRIYGKLPDTPLHQIEGLRPEVTGERSAPPETPFQREQRIPRPSIVPGEPPLLRRSNESGSADLGNPAFQYASGATIGALAGPALDDDPNKPVWEKMLTGAGIGLGAVAAGRGGANLLLRRAPTPKATTVEEAVNLAKAQYGEGVTLHLVKNESDLPPEWRANIDPSKPHEALINSNTGEAYIFRDNLNNPERAQQVLAHEVAGHYGFDQMVSEKDWAGIQQAALRDPQAKSIARDYFGVDDPSTLDPKQQLRVAREYVARIAENTPLNPSLWDKMSTATRKGLREFGLKKEWTEAELQGLIQRGNTEISQRRGPMQEVPPNQNLEASTPTAFNKWFGTSKAVDEKGAPVVAYHGSPEKFSAFDPNAPINDSGDLARGFYFTTDKRRAGVYGGDKGVVHEVHLRLENPASDADYTSALKEADRRLSAGEEPSRKPLLREASDRFMEHEVKRKQMATDILKERGFDGMSEKSRWTGHTEYSVFDPTQIKSVENSGAYDPKNPDIYASLPRRMDQAAADQERGKKTLLGTIVRPIEREFGLNKPDALKLSEEKGKGARNLLLHKAEPVLEAQKATTDPEKQALLRYEQSDKGQQAQQILRQSVRPEVAKSELEYHDLVSGAQEELAQADPAMRDLVDATKGDWKTVRYAAFNDASMWEKMKRADPNLRENYIDQLTRDKVLGDASREDVAQAVGEYEAEIQRGGGSSYHVGSGSSRISQYLTTARKNLSPEHKAFLGEYTNPNQIKAFTLNKLANSISQAKKINELASAGERGDIDIMPMEKRRALIEQARQSGDAKRVQELSDLVMLRKDQTGFGKLAGQMVPRSVIDSLNAHGQMWEGGWLKAFAKPTSVMKQSLTVLNPGTHARQWLQTPLLAAVARVAPWDFITAARILREKGGAMYEEMVRNNIIGADFSSAELQRGAKQLDTLYNPNALQKAGQMAKGLLDKAQSAYGLPDRLIRVAAYAKAKARFMAEGMSEAKAQDAATLFTNRYTMNYSAVPNALKVARETPFVTPFLSYQSEMLRILTNLGEDAISGDASTRTWALSNLAGLVAMPLIVANMAESALSDKDKKDWERTKRLSPEYAAGQIRVPISRKKDGSFNYLNLGNLVPAGDSAAFARNLATGQFSDALKQNPIIGVDKTPVLNTISEQISGEDKTTGRKFTGPVDRALDVGKQFLPPLVPPNYEAQRAVNSFTPNAQGGLGIENPRTGRTDTPGTFLLRQAGVGVSQVQPAALLRRAVSDQREKESAIASERNLILRSPSYTPEAKKEASEKAQRLLRQSREDYRARIR